LRQRLKHFVPEYQLKSKTDPAVSTNGQADNQPKDEQILDTSAAEN